MSRPCSCCRYPGDSDALQDLELRTKALAVISLCVGVIVTLIGLLRLGFLLDFVSVPVLKGFTAAACTITILAVFKDILGCVVGMGLKGTPFMPCALLGVVFSRGFYHGAIGNVAGYMSKSPSCCTLSSRTCTTQCRLMA